MSVFRSPASRRITAMAAPLLALALAAGCGSGNDSAASQGSSSVGSASPSQSSATGSPASADSSSGEMATTAGGSSDAASGSGAGATGSAAAASTAAASSGTTAPSAATGSDAPMSSGEQTAATAEPQAQGLDAKGCITSFDPTADYYPDKQKLLYAKNFTIEYARSYQVVTVTPPGGAAESYVLVHCGAPKPALTGALAKAQVLTTPVSSLYSSSTTHLPALVALDQLDALTGVGSAAFVSEPQVLEHFAAHKPVEYAPTGSVDAEAVVKGKPQVLVGGGFPDAADPKLKAAGIVVMQDVDAMEPTPLGQAEWIKLFAALTGTEGKAEQVFGAVVSDYQKTAALVAGKPKVQIVPGQPYQGTWYVPGGKTWKTKLFDDAGGTTAWAKDTSSGNVQTNFEKVFASSGKAKVWLASTTWTSLADALKEEPRFATFAAFKAGNVWNPVKGVTAAGGNPYYELGAARPDLVLGDLVAILHPELMPDHEFTFFVKLK